MIETFLNILPSALGVAISPLPIVAVILMLMSKRAKANGIAFVAGWIIALGVVIGVILWLAHAGNIAPGGDPSTSTHIILLALGILLIGLAARNWWSRPRKGQTPVMPTWMAAIDRFTAGKAFGVAFVLAGINPKNLMLTIAGTLSIVTAELHAGQELAMAASFVVIGSLTVAAPVLYLLIAPQSASHLLHNSKAWLIRNNAVIMALLLLVIGLKVTITAAKGLW